jgi:cupin fold WbuC family metalloprotein
MNALTNVSGPVWQATPEVLESLHQAAAASPRRRMILPLHRTQEAPVQRMLNALEPGTYVRPHRHSGEGASESILVLRGELAFFVFAENGEIQSMLHLDATREATMVDVEPGVWHAFLVLSPRTLIFEAKRGPYSPIADKDFAPWAPSEGDAGAGAFLEMLREQWMARSGSLPS